MSGGAGWGRLALVLVGALPSLACDPGESSDAGEYGLRVTAADQLGRNSDRLLVGTRFELELTSAPTLGPDDDPPDDRLDCVELSASGSLDQLAAGPRNGTFEVASPGPGAVELGDPNLSCVGDPTLAELGPDRWSIVGVEASAVVGGWIVDGEGEALDWGMSPGPAARFPTGFAEPSETLRAVAGSEFSAVPVLLDPSAGPLAEVRINPEQAELTVPARWSDLDTAVGEPGSESRLAGRISPGERFTASFEVLGASVPLPVEAVAVDEIVSLDLIPVYWPASADQNQREWGPPIALMAIARDAEGDRVFGPPIEWSVTRGRLAVFAGSESIEVADCKAAPRQPSWRGATVEARLGELVATAELEWVALPSDETDPDDPLCTGSTCDCSTTAPPAGSALAGLALLGLGGWLRRRPRTR